MSRRGQKLALLAQSGSGNGSGAGPSTSRQQKSDSPSINTLAQTSTATQVSSGKDARCSSSMTIGSRRNLVKTSPVRSTSRSPIRGLQSGRGASKGAAASLRNSFRGNLLASPSGRGNTARKRPAPGSTSAIKSAISSEANLAQQIRSRPRTLSTWPSAADHDVSMDSIESVWSRNSDFEGRGRRADHMSVFDFGDPCNSNHSSSSMRFLLKRTTSGGGSAHREEFENTHSDNVDGMDPVDGTDPSSREEVSRDALAKLAPSVPHMSEKEFRAQDAKLVEDAEAERNAAVKDMSARFCEGFEAEWALQRQRMDAACTTMLRGLDEQLAEEKGREDLARSTWEFQMRKAAKEDARLMDNLQATQDESKLCDAQLARFHSSAQDLASTADSDELQQLMATLLHTARLVRREKDTRMNDQLSALADVVKCVICQDHARSVVFMPCRHMCVCPSCRKQLQRNECPMCRARIESSVNVVLNEGSIRN